MSASRSRQLELVEDVRRASRDRQVDVLGDRPALDAHGAALRLQPLARAGRARPQRAIRLEVLLLDPGAFFVAAAQVRDEPFEAGAERILRGPSLAFLRRVVGSLRRPLPARRRTADRASSASSRRNGSVEIDAERAAQRCQAPRGPACGRPSPTARSRRPAATAIRPARAARDRSRTTAPRPWQSGQAPCGELNENARGVISGMLTPQYVHASRRENSRSPPSSVLMTTMSSARLRAISTDSVSRRSTPGLRIRRSTTTSIVWLRRRSSLMSSSSESQLAVDADLGEAARAQRRQLLLELALAAADDRRQHVDALVVRREHHHVDDALERLRRDLAPAEVAVRHADVGEQQPQVVVDLGDRADGRARIRAGGLLLDGDGRRQAVDQIDVRLLHLLEELPGVRRQRLDIAPLAFGVDRVEGERRLARARQAGDDDQLVARDVDVDVLEVVDARAAHRNPVVRHSCTAAEFLRNVQNGQFYHLRGASPDQPSGRELTASSDAQLAFAAGCGGSRRRSRARARAPARCRSAPRRASASPSSM